MLSRGSLLALAKSIYYNFHFHKKAVIRMDPNVTYPLNANRPINNLTEHASVES